MAKSRKVWLDYLVYVAVRLVVCILQTMSMEMAYRVAAAFAWLAHAVDRRHRKVALENLELAFGRQYTEAERQEMVREVYLHFARVVVEMALIPRKLRIYNYRRFVTMENMAPAVAAMLSGRPQIIVTAHYGNWEMAGFLIAQLGVETFAIARDLDNPYLDRFVRKFREYTGQTILSKTGDIDRIQKVLAENQVLITLADQSAGPRGYFVDFFGRSASTHKAVAILAMKYDAQLLIGYAFRDRPNFHYRVVCHDVIDPRDYAERADGAIAMTQEFTRLLEEGIRRAPGQYLWLHRRWKHQPPEKAALRKAA